MNKASVSIITVTYNSGETISRTINSVLNQTTAPLEYIIIDGCSTDLTVSIAEEFRQSFEDAGIKYIIVSEHDNGMYDAMNKGIEMASGDLIGIINSDDWYEPCAVETVIQTYAQEPFDYFYADLRMHKRDGSVFVKRARNRKYATSRDWNHPTTFITSQIYKQYKYKNKTLHDDYDLILRLKKNGAKAIVRNVVLANFAMSGTTHNINLKKALKTIKTKYNIYREDGYPPYYIIEPTLEEIGKLIIG